MAEKEKKKKGGFLQGVKEFVYGLAAHDSARFALKDTSQYGASLHTDNNGGHAWRADSASLLFPQTSTVRSPADLYVET